MAYIDCDKCYHGRVCAHRHHYHDMIVECNHHISTADVAEVVICQDCKWWIGERCLNPNGAYNCVTGPYWFCKSGQRREKENASNTEC